MSRKIILVLSILGLFVSGYLAWVYLFQSHIACTTHGCEAVRKSSYANFFGIPQPLFGIIFYLLVAFLASISQNLRKIFTFETKKLIIMISTIGFVYSVYLTSIEAFVIRAFCDWCLASAFISTLIFIIAIRSAIYEKTI